MSGGFADQFSCHNELSGKKCRKMLKHSFHGKVETITAFFITETAKTKEI